MFFNSGILCSSEHIADLNKNPYKGVNDVQPKKIN